MPTAGICSGCFAGPADELVWVKYSEPGTDTSYADGVAAGGARPGLRGRRGPGPGPLPAPASPGAGRTRPAGNLGRARAVGGGGELRWLAPVGRGGVRRLL